MLGGPADVCTPDGARPPPASPAGRVGTHGTRCFGGLLTAGLRAECCEVGIHTSFNSESFGTMPKVTLKVERPSGD